MGGAEIKRSSRQSQCAVTVLPAVANGADRVAVLHDEFAGAEHHVLVRHGEDHGRLVVWFGVVDGVAVPAVDLGIGSDGHDSACVGVGGPIRRHTVDFLDLSIGGGRIHGDGVATCYPGWFCTEVEYAAGHGAFVCHTAREGAASDFSAAVYHCFLKGSTRDFSSGVVCHYSLKGSVRNRSVGPVFHCSIKGAFAIDGAVVCHTARKGTVLDGAAVYHGSSKGASLDGAAVCHGFMEGTAGNFHTRLSHNRTRHSRIGRCCLGSVLGIGQTEIKRSTVTRQSQFAGQVRYVFFTVSPSVALAADSTVFGADRVAARHDEVAGAKHHVHVRHGEFHGLLVAAVAAVAVARVDGLAVQAIDFGVGGDGHFLRLARFDHDVGVPNRRHIVDFLDLGIRGGLIHGDVVDTSSRRSFYDAVEHAASHATGFHRQARREGAVFDRSTVPVFHTALKGAAADGSAVVLHCTCTTEGSARDCSIDAVFHCSIEGAVRYGAFVHHTALEGAVLDGAFVSHAARFLEGTTADEVVVFHCTTEGAARDFSGVFVCHFSIEAAVADGVVVFHTARVLEFTTADDAVVYHSAREGAVADGAAVCHSAHFLEVAAVYIFVVCHIALEGTVRDRSVVV